MQQVDGYIVAKVGWDFVIRVFRFEVTDRSQVVNRSTLVHGPVNSW